MASFALIHGAGSTGWDWHLVAAELRARGHEVLAPDLPCGSATATLDDYVAAVVDAIGDREDVVVVAHSLGGFTAPLVCRRVAARLLIMVTAMIPAPGERVADWWTNTGYDKATAGDTHTDDEIFFHDVPPELAAAAKAQAVTQADAAMLQPWPGERWPDVPTRFIVCRDDRLFPAEWMRGLVAERLGIAPEEMDGGHYVALSRPLDLADMLESYLKLGTTVTPVALPR
ncbi:MAG TPA: alpha/beta hydrolase [Stackebrandtia sp.]|jgi:pimeloyl-ACP methyl ester carboxylesterase|uniref:alpha/beta fold hydrolase n=1 Tax=Stackebrandtia sp. TaxID=2023065 RepID=UPI002D4662A4|nr:alpha/beta hydrolase [Stackebrandtia sp.]HZE38853.1 alpha/beta hydrolase [Stackebrandtia sp.]